ncbi:MAG: hypothetical protein ACYC96_07920 [Fimbriimonadaceae bacterium]
MPLLWMLAMRGASEPRTTLTFVNNAFVVSYGGAASQRFSIAPEPPAVRKKVEFRSDAKFVTWDKRGLTIRVGSRATSTRFKDIPTSPRLRTHDAIVGTLDAVRRGGRSLAATAVSGSRRFGKSVYLVVRWEDGPGRPWLEALVSVDLDADKPTAQAIAVLPGLSFSSAQIADNLVAGPNGVSILLHAGPAWGLWSYRPDTGQADYHMLGDGVKYAAAVSPDIAAFVEKTHHGTFAAGTVDLSTGARADTAEAPTLWKMLDAKAPPVAEATDDGGGRILAELSSGAVYSLPDGATVRRAGEHVVIWIGGSHPDRAWLYDPTTWKPLAWWRGG